MPGDGDHTPVISPPTHVPDESSSTAVADIGAAGDRFVNRTPERKTPPPFTTNPLWAPMKKRSAAIRLAVGYQDGLHLPSTRKLRLSISPSPNKEKASAPAGTGEGSNMATTATKRRHDQTTGDSPETKRACPDNGPKAPPSSPEPMSQ